MSETEPPTPNPAPQPGSRALIRAPKWALDAAPDREVALRVCEAVAFGRSMADIERDPVFPPRDLFISWLMRDPELALAFNRAREMSSYVLEDEAIELLRSRLTKPGSSVEVRAVDLLVQQLRWSAAKRNQQVFSEKAAVNVTVPVQINTTLDMGPAGPSAGTREFPNIYELKAELIQEAPALPEIDEEDIRSPDLIEAPPVPRRLKRILVPKPRAAETAAERDERLRRTKQLMDQSAAKALARRNAKAARQARYRRDKPVR